MKLVSCHVPLLMCTGSAILDITYALMQNNHQWQLNKQYVRGSICLDINHHQWHAADFMPVSSKKTCGSAA